MFVVFLRFAANRAKAGQFMSGHNEWIRRGFDDGVFLLVGSLQPALGGGILAHNTSLADLQGRVKEDPFVAEHGDLRDCAIANRRALGLSGRPVTPTVLESY
jgi:uncharacterized protein YciI